MDILRNIDSFLDFYLVRHLPAIMIFLLVIDAIWKKQNFQFSYIVIRYILLLNWALLLFFILFGWTIINSENRATGPYWWAYWIMIISSLVLPGILIHKKWGRNKWILLIVTLLSTAGTTFELFVILITNLYADYAFSGGLVGQYFFTLIVRPFIMVCFLVGIDVIFFRNRQNNHKKKEALENVLDAE